LLLLLYFGITKHCGEYWVLQLSLKYLNLNGHVPGQQLASQEILGKRLKLIRGLDLSFLKFTWAQPHTGEFRGFWEVLGASEGRRRKFSLISSIELKKKEGRNKGNSGYFIAYGILYGLPLWNSTYFFTV
jgi:hypothetical protein